MISKTIPASEAQRIGHKIVQDCFNQGLNSSDIGMILSVACGTLLVNAPTLTQFFEVQKALIESIDGFQPQSNQTGMVRG